MSFGKVLCAMVKSLLTRRPSPERTGGFQNRRVPNVRTLFHYHRPGGHAAAVRLSGTAEFSAALQYRSDPAGADRAPRSGQAAICPGALGAHSVLGERSQEVRAFACGAWRIRQRE